MNQPITRRIRTVVLAGGLILFPLGCGAQDEEVQLDLRIDATPIEREEQSPVNSYAQTLRIARPAVVSVFSQRLVEEGLLQDHPALRRFFGEEMTPRERFHRGVGSGVIVSPQGYILTNDHVIEDAEIILVQFANGGEEVEAEVVGRDPATDIAVLRIDVNYDLPYAVLGDSDSIEVGDIVFALGNALGIGHAVTSGIISARGRTGIGILGQEGYEDFIQTDASMNIGNSGGPLVDTKGRVIGINTAIASPGGGNVGIGFAIPINMARDVMRNLLEYGEVRRGYLGLVLQDSREGRPREYGAPARNGPADEGVLVVNVVGDSPAAEAGLERGDLIFELDGEPVESASDLRVRIAQRGPDAEVGLGVLRGGERLNVDVVLGTLEPDAFAATDVPQGDELLPGISVVALTPVLRRELHLSREIEGLLVTAISEGSPYADAFVVGGVIMQINRQSVEDLADARDQIERGRNLFLFFHEGAFHYIVLEIDNG